jgi:hypothetical protein
VELAIMVIFNDHCIPTAGPCEELDAPGERKNDSGWKLVRRGYEDQFCVLRKSSGIQALTINGDRQQSGTGGAKHFSYSRIVRVFDCYAITALDKHSSNEIERLLGAIDDNHLRRITDYGSRTPYVSADGFTQVKTTDSFAVIEVANGRHSCMPHQDPPP